MATVALLVFSGLTLADTLDDATDAPAPPGSDAGYVRVQDRPDGAFATIQEAIDAAAPGDLVLVPADPDTVAPSAHLGPVTIAKDGITLCASVGGSPICAEDMRPGHWELSRSVWSESPGIGYGDAILLDGGTGWGSDSFYPPAGFRAADLKALTLDLYMLEESPSDMYCGGGSPRIQLGVDTNGDGARDKNIQVYNSVFSSADCAPLTWHYVDYLEPAQSRWYLGNLGGPSAVTHTAALDWLAANTPGYDIVAINAVVDNGAIAVIDNHRINGWVLGEQQDLECGWGEGLGCRWDDTRPRTIVDAAGAAHAIKVTADDVTIHGLTIASSADKKPTVGLALQGDRAIIRDNDISGPFQATGHDGSATIQQIGVDVGRSGASDLTIERNRITGWSNIGMLLRSSAGAGTLIRDNEIAGNRWHGILAEGPAASQGAAAVTVEANRIADHGHSALRWSSSSPETLSVRHNLFAPSNIHAVTVHSAVAGKTFDLRLNDWGLYDHLTLPERIDDESGTNTFLQTPFLDTDGTPQPPLVGRRTGDTVDTFLSIQDAVDDAGTLAGSRILLSPARTPYGPATLDKQGISLCSTVGGGECFGDVTRTTAGPIEVTAHDVSITLLTLAGGSPVLTATEADRFTLEGSVVRSDADASSARQGIRIIDSPGATIQENDITGNLYPGSVALGLERSDDATVRANRIVDAGTAMWLMQSERGRIEENQILITPASQWGGDSLGISLREGGVHTTMANTIYGAGIGLLVAGAHDVMSEGDSFLATKTGIDARGVGTAPYTQPHGLTFRNATLAGAVTALRLDEKTRGLEVDARCNDWGAYQAATIENVRIRDDGADNEIAYSPYVGPLADAEPFPFGCLRLPQPGFSFEPAAPVYNETVDFTDLSTEGSRPIAQRHWAFGDGSSATETAPFDGPGPAHVYEAGGSYLATLTVTDVEGTSATVVRPLVVQGPPEEIRAPAQHPAPAGQLMRLRIDIVGLEGPVTLAAEGLPATAELKEIGNSPTVSKWRLDWKPEKHHAGTHNILLTATDGIDTLLHELTLLIDSDEPPVREVRFAKTGASPGTARPGQVVTFTADIRNTQSGPVEVVLTPKARPGWQTAVAGGSAITLAPGEVRPVGFTVRFGDAVDALVTLTATPVGSPDAEQVTSWYVRIPVVTSVVMQQVEAGDAIRGFVLVRYTDGSPAADRTVELVRTYDSDLAGAASSQASGRTDKDGLFLFSFPASDAGAQTPGAHTLAIDVYSPLRQREVFGYSVEA